MEQTADHANFTDETVEAAMFPRRGTAKARRLWYDEPNAVSNAIGYAIHSSRSHGAVIRVYDATGNVIETHDHKGDFKEW